MAEDIIARFVADTKQFDQQMDKLKKGIQDADDTQVKFGQDGEQAQKKVAEATKDTAKKTEELGRIGDKVFSMLDTLTFGLASKMRGLIGSIGAVTTGMKGLRAAIISTGIGALVVAVGTLITYFTQTQRGADAVSRVMKGLGATFSVITDRVSALGEGLVNAFQNPRESVAQLWEFIKNNFLNRIKAVPAFVTAIGKTIKEGFALNFEAAGDAAIEAGQAFIQFQTGFDTEQQQKIADSIKGVANEIKEEASAAFELEKQLQDLEDMEISLIRVNEKLRSSAEELRMQAEDETLTNEERAASLRAAIAAENELYDNQIKVAKERARILQEQIALGESSRDEIKEGQQALAEVDRLEGQRARRLRSIQTRLNAFTKEQNEANKALEDTSDALVSEDDIREPIELLTRISDVTIETEEAQQDSFKETTKALKEELDKRRSDLEEYEQERIDMQEAQKEAEAEAAERRKQEFQNAQDELINATVQTTGLLIQSSESRLDALRQEFETSTGLRKQELADQINTEKQKIQNLKRAQLAALAIQEAVALGRAFAELGPIAGAIAAAGLAIKFGLLFAQLEGQAFAEGTDYVEPANSTQGRRVDDIPAWLTKGEAVIPKKSNLKNRDLVRSLVKGNVDDFIKKRYVYPEVEAILNGSTGGVVASLNDANIVRELQRSDRNRKIEAKGLYKVLKSQKQSKRYAAI